MANVDYLLQVFPSWNEDDLVAVLGEVNNDVNAAVDRISQGHAKQWSQVKKKETVKKNSTERQNERTFMKGNGKGRFQKSGMEAKGIKVVKKPAAMEGKSVSLKKPGKQETTLPKKEAVKKQVHKNEVSIEEPKTKTVQPKDTGKPLWSNIANPVKESVPAKQNTLKTAELDSSSKTEKKPKKIELRKRNEVKKDDKFEDKPKTEGTQKNDIKPNIEAKIDTKSNSEPIGPKLTGPKTKTLNVEKLQIVDRPHNVEKTQPIKPKFTVIKRSEFKPAVAKVEVEEPVHRFGNLPLSAKAETRISEKTNQGIRRLEKSTQTPPLMPIPMMTPDMYRAYAAYYQSESPKYDQSQFMHVPYPYQNYPKGYPQAYRPPNAYFGYNPSGSTYPANMQNGYPTHYAHQTHQSPVEKDSSYYSFNGKATNGNFDYRNNYFPNQYGQDRKQTQSSDHSQQSWSQY